MHPLQALSVTLAAFGLLAALLAVNRHMRHRRISASGHTVLSVLLVAAGVLLWPIGSGLAACDALRPGQPVADLYFEQLADSRYRITLTRLPGGRMQVFDVGGTLWRLDARRLDWKGWTVQLGPEPRFQLDRLTSFGKSPTQTTADPAPVSTFDLADPAGTVLWQRARTGAQWRRVVDARQLYGPNVPMRDKARFELTISEQGLAATPANEAAAAAVTAAP